MKLGPVYYFFFRLEDNVRQAGHMNSVGVRLVPQHVPVLCAFAINSDNERRIVCANLSDQSFWFNVIDNRYYESKGCRSINE